MIAVDVAYGQLDWRLREDPRVPVIERLNARDLGDLRPALSARAVTVDVSFISLAKVMPAVVASGCRRLDLLAMVKPQFELGRERVGRAASSATPRDRREAIRRVAEAAQQEGLPSAASPPPGCPGPKGNRETFVWAARQRGGRRPRCRDSRRSSRDRDVKRVMLITPLAPAGGRRGGGHRGRGGRGPAGGSSSRPPTSSPSTATPPTEIETGRRTGERPDLCLVLGGDGTILHALRHFAAHGRPRLRRQLRHGRLPGRGRARRARRVVSTAPSPATSRRSTCRRSTVDLPIDHRGGPQRRQLHAAAPTAGSPSSATGSPARRWATSAATGWSPRPRPARPATTSPTRARSWPGA